MPGNACARPPRCRDRPILRDDFVHDERLLLPPGGQALHQCLHRSLVLIEIGVGPMAEVLGLHLDLIQGDREDGAEFGGSHAIENFVRLRHQIILKLVKAR